MSEKQNNDKSFEQKNQQKRRDNPANDSVPTISYREIRAKSESERKKKTQSGKAKAQKTKNDKRHTPQNPHQQHKTAGEVHKNHSQQTTS